MAYAGYYYYMDVLENLEIHINNLLARLDSLKSENARLQNELAMRVMDIENLTEKNNTLRAELERELRLREEALARIDALLYKVREHDSVG